MNDNTYFAEAFLNLAGIRLYVDDYVIHDDLNYRFVMKDDEMPLYYNKNNKSIVYRFHPYVMPYDTFVKLIDVMHEQGYLPFRLSPTYFTEKIEHAQYDDNIVIEICRVNYLDRPNPNAYLTFSSIVKPTIASNAPTLLFDDMGGVL